MKGKIYFSHYGEVTSMNHVDAVKLATDAICNKHWSLDDKTSYPSAINLKGRNSNREDGYIKVGKRYVEVNHCLDWQTEDWKIFLSNITQK